MHPGSCNPIQQLPPTSHSSVGPPRPLASAPTYDPQGQQQQEHRHTLTTTTASGEISSLSEGRGLHFATQYSGSTDFQSPSQNNQRQQLYQYQRTAGAAADSPSQLSSFHHQRHHTNNVMGVIDNSLHSSSSSSRIPLPSDQLDFSFGTTGANINGGSIAFSNNNTIFNSSLSSSQQQHIAYGSNLGGSLGNNQWGIPPTPYHFPPPHHNPLSSAPSSPPSDFRIVSIHQPLPHHYIPANGGGHTLPADPAASSGSFLSHNPNHFHNNNSRFGGVGIDGPTVGGGGGGGLQIPGGSTVSSSAGGGSSSMIYNGPAPFVMPLPLHSPQPSTTSYYQHRPNIISNGGTRVVMGGSYNSPQTTAYHHQQQVAQNRHFGRGGGPPVGGGRYPHHHHHQQEQKAVNGRKKAPTAPPPPPPPPSATSVDEHVRSQLHMQCQALFILGLTEEAADLEWFKNRARWAPVGYNYPSLPPHLTLLLHHPSPSPTITTPPPTPPIAVYGREEEDALSLPNENGNDKEEVAVKEPYRKLIVNAVPSTADNNDLQLLFSEYGELEGCRIAQDRGRNRSKGYAFVYFKRYQDATEALLKCNYVEVKGRCLRVSFSLNPLNKMLFTSDDEEEDSTTHHPSRSTRRQELKREMERNKRLGKEEGELDGSEMGSFPSSPPLSAKCCNDGIT